MAPRWTPAALAAPAYRRRERVLGTLLVTAVVLAGCTTPSGRPADTAAPSVSASAQAARWHPAHAISHQTLTDAEGTKLRDAKLAQLARQGKIKNPPRVDLIRWTTVDDNATTMANCLTKAGFTAEAVGQAWEFPDGIPASQESAYNLTEYRCYAQYSLHPKYTVDWTDDQLGLVYDYDYESLVPCLTTHGITTTPAPTRATFIAGWRTGDRWEPFQQAVITNPDRERELTEICPEFPSSEDLYG